MTFDQALADWNASADACITARVAYERAYATACLAADGKNETARKAQADLAALNEWEAWKRADAAATGLWQLLTHLNPASAARPVLL